MRKKITLFVLVCLAIYEVISRNSDLLRDSTQQTAAGDQQITAAFNNQTSDIQVAGAGIVVRTLADDNKGSRHQKMLVKLDSGRTVLIVHNIDLAPRINALREGDTLAFYGEYEWNDRGGLVHWTHRDPGGRHEHGWLKHNGITYD